MHTKEIKNLKELKKIGFEFVKLFKIPQLILLEGPLAVGKSQMVQYMSEALGLAKEEFCSPTFSLINVYKQTKKTSIYHVDLYRLEKQEDIEAIAFWDIFYSETIVFIEWPHLVKTKLPPLWNKLHIQMDFLKNSNSRILKWKNEVL